MPPPRSTYQTWAKKRDQLAEQEAMLERQLPVFDAMIAAGSTAVYKVAIGATNTSRHSSYNNVVAERARTAVKTVELIRNGIEQDLTKVRAQIVAHKAKEPKR